MVIYIKLSRVFNRQKYAINTDSCRYNGKALIDEDMLREIGINDFTKYRADPNHEPARMMPAKFPSLLVEEENEDPILKSPL